jgi:hypothetical protein
MGKRLGFKTSVGMAMKKATLLILPLLLTAIFVLPARCEDYGKAELWVLIVGGPEIRAGYRQFLWDGYYCYYTMTRRYEADHITWLYWEGNQNEIDPGSINGTSTKANVHSAITDWLSNADANDIIFIYLECNGKGYNVTSGEYPIEAFDVSGDEGLEHYNSTTEEWFGVDECMLLYGWEEQNWEIYWDDELAADLDTLSYGELILFIPACYGGGLIDDLSDENRAIITPTNETCLSQTDHDGDGYSEFDEVFFDALYGYNTTSKGHEGIITENPIDADYDGNGFVSIQEAFRYAYTHDDARWVVGHYVEHDKPVDESPWFDCDGNGCPTYLNGDILDEDDLDSEPIYLYRLFTLIVSCSSGGCVFPGAGTYRYKEGTVVWLMAWPFSGYYFVWWWVDGGINYGEDYGGVYNVLFLEMNSDHFVYACFAPGTGGGGGETCPTLFVWNGTAWIDYGVIDIHNPTGEDVIREIPIQAEDVGLNNHKAKFRLREGWEGLNFSESVIDQVKLYAINEDGKQKLCPLLSAEHSRLGDAREFIVSSDDIRVQTLLLETIGLTFKVPYKNVQSYTFVIEGCNMLKM